MPGSAVPVQGAWIEAAIPGAWGQRYTTCDRAAVRHDTVKIQVRVGPSRIAGQGLFAAQAIPKGTRIMAYIGEKITSRESARRRAAGNVYIFHLNYHYAIDG